MPTYSYQARDESGRLVKGVLEAESPVSLAERLRRMGYLVTRMEQACAGGKGLFLLSWGRPVPEEPLLLAAIQLANLVEAGVPLVSSLQTVASQTMNRPLKTALEAVTKGVEQGASFSQALSHHPDIFPKLMTGMAAVGEASGHLDTVLTRFAAFVEKDLALRRAVQGALTYPMLLLIAATLLILFVVSFIVPQFSALFAKAGIPLPLATQILQVAGETIRTRGWLLAGGVAAASVGVSLILQVPRIRLRFDTAVLKLPAVGEVIHQTVVARFARTLGTLVGAGLPILKALESAEAVVGNQAIAREVRRVRATVESGERIAETLSVGRVFHPDAIQMIRVGEESGRLDGMLEKIAEFYERRVNFSLKQMTTLLEPILLVGMGGIVAGIMASLLLPMFDMVKVLQQGGIR